MRLVWLRVMGPAVLLEEVLQHNVWHSVTWQHTSCMCSPASFACKKVAKRGSRFQSFCAPDHGLCITFTLGMWSGTSTRPCSLLAPCCKQPQHIRVNNSDGFQMPMLALC